MTARKFFRLVAVLTSILVIRSETQAGVMLSAVPTVNGSNVTVQFNLIDTDGAPSLATLGLAAFDFRINYDPVQLAFQSALIDPSFGLLFSVLPGYDDSVTGQLDLYGGATNASEGVTGTSVPLASVTFRSLVGGPSIITLGPSDDSLNAEHFVLADFTLLDTLLFAPDVNNTFDLIAPPPSIVPEPGSVAVFTILGLCVLRRQSSRVVFRAR